LRQFDGEATPVGLKFKDFSVLLIKLGLHSGEAGVIVDPANVDHEEVVDEILPQDEEYPVVLLRIAHLLAIIGRYGVPKVPIPIRSPSGPLLLAPRVPHLQHFVRRLV
jgi:hypothetical protein